MPLQPFEFAGIMIIIIQYDKVEQTCSIVGQFNYCSLGLRQPLSNVDKIIIEMFHNFIVVCA